MTPAWWVVAGLGALAFGLVLWGTGALRPEFWKRGKRDD